MYQIFLTLGDSQWSFYLILQFILLFLCRLFFFLCLRSFSLLASLFFDSCYLLLLFVFFRCYLFFHYVFFMLFFCYLFFNSLFIFYTLLNFPIFILLLLSIQFILFLPRSTLCCVERRNLELQQSSQRKVQQCLGCPQHQLFEASMQM